MTSAGKSEFPYCVILFDTGDGMFLDLSSNKISIMDEEFFDQCNNNESKLNLNSLEMLTSGLEITNTVVHMNFLVTLNSEGTLRKFRMSFNQPISSESEDSLEEAE